VQHKWKLKGTIIKIENSLNDVYGKEFSKSIIKEIRLRTNKFIDDL